MAVSELLREAEATFVAHEDFLNRLTRRTHSFAFAGGTLWIAAAMGRIRGKKFRPVMRVARAERCNRLGCLKYGLASLGALLVTTPALFHPGPISIGFAALAVIPAFYLLEAPLVFLFPLLADGSRRPLRDALRLVFMDGAGFPVNLAVTTGRVMCIALYMLSNPRAPVRRWYTGVLAVVIWYRSARNDTLSPP